MVRAGSDLDANGPGARSALRANSHAPDPRAPCSLRAPLQAALFGFVGANPTIAITFADADTRKRLPLTIGGKTSEVFLFMAHDDVRGTVSIEPPKGKSRLEHMGIKVELIGRIGALSARCARRARRHRARRARVVSRCGAARVRARSHLVSICRAELSSERGVGSEFTHLVRELEPAGELAGARVYPFEFCNVEKQHESYDGVNARLRYVLRVTIARHYNSNVVFEQDLRVHVISHESEVNTSIKMEVGIEDCLHIEFEYNRGKYHLRDVILGKIYFLLVRIKIKHMELAIVKRESSGTGASTFNESETVTKFEIMDGAPVRNETIPIRLFLSGFDQLTPTMRNVNNKFSVKYYLNLVLIDEEDRRYFKQQEITLFRKI
jgi:vacuolar protein sorting-associated protein 26